SRSDLARPPWRHSGGKDRDPQERSPFVRSGPSSPTRTLDRFGTPALLATKNRLRSLAVSDSAAFFSVKTLAVGDVSVRLDVDLTAFTRNRQDRALSDGYVLGDGLHRDNDIGAFFN